MANKQKVHVLKTCPYVLNECLLSADECGIRNMEYDQIQKAAGQCSHRGDKLDNRGWIEHYKMVTIKIGQGRDE